MACHIPFTRFIKRVSFLLIFYQPNALTGHHLTHATLGTGSQIIQLLPSKYLSRCSTVDIVLKLLSRKLSLCGGHKGQIISVRATVDQVASDY